MHKNTHSRSTKQLVVLWRDLKAKAKKDYAAQKKSTHLTGGGTNMVKIDPIIHSWIKVWNIAIYVTFFKLL